MTVGRSYIAENFNTGQATGSETGIPARKAAPDMTFRQEYGWHDEIA